MTGFAGPRSGSTPALVPTDRASPRERKVKVEPQSDLLIPKTGRETLTVAIPTKDVANLLADCLTSVAWADEIIVVDMFSSDDTEEICARYPQCRFFQRSDYI